MIKKMKRIWYVIVGLIIILFFVGRTIGDKVWMLKSFWISISQN